MIGRTSTAIPLLTSRSFGTLKILDTLTPTSQLRCVVIIFSAACSADAKLDSFQPLAPANGAPPDATRDPLLRDKVYGAEILDVRKALAFAGFTHKSPRAIEYTRVDQAFDNSLNVGHGLQGTVRGRPLVREARPVGKGRAISM